MGHPVGQCGARAGGGGRVASNPPYNMNFKLKLLLSETKNGYTLPAKIYPTVCVCHSVVLAFAISPSPSSPLPSPITPLALLWWVCCRAMDDKDNLLSCLSPRVQLDWQFRLQRTPGQAQISLFRLPTISSPRLLGNCQTVTISKVLSEFLSRNLPKRGVAFAAMWGTSTEPKSSKSSLWCVRGSSLYSKT